MARKKKHETKISQYYDGEIMWSELDGVYSWYDGEFSHHITLANTLKFWKDFINSMAEAVEAQADRMEVIPQVVAEIGDMSFAEYEWRERNYYV
jgi:hypothetical protein